MRNAKPFGQAPNSPDEGLGNTIRLLVFDAFVEQIDLFLRSADLVCSGAQKGSFIGLRDVIPIAEAALREILILMNIIESME